MTNAATANARPTSVQPQVKQQAASSVPSVATKTQDAASVKKVEVSATRVVDANAQEPTVSDIIETTGVPEATEVVSIDAQVATEETQDAQVENDATGIVVVEADEEPAQAAEEPQADPEPAPAEPEPVAEKTALETCLDKVNAIRARYGIGAALQIDNRLQNGAAAHAANMRASGQVYHAPGCGFEICAQSFGASIDGAINQFLNSPAHRAILLQSGFRTCGIGQYNDQYGRAYVAIRFGY